MLNLSKRLCNISGYSAETALKLYENITCMVIGKNKNEVEVAEVNIFKRNLEKFYENNE